MRPQNGVHSEFVEGELIERPCAPFDCGAAAQILAVALTDFACQNNAGAIINAGTGFQLARDPDTVLAPSLAFAAEYHLPSDLPNLVGFFPGAPDLAVEVTSPSETYGQVETKVARYL